MSQDEREIPGGETTPLGTDATRPEPPRDRPAPGVRIGGRYELLGFLGMGGMGSVYRVLDRELDEVVALKFLRRFDRSDDYPLEQFRQEVKLARRVTHPNVARTFDIGEHRGGRFLTMEYVDGESLTKMLERGAVPLRRGIEIGIAVCSGLAAAHQAGVVHRDLKPENVLLERAGRVVITDFGIARSPADQGASNDRLAGTPAYMAPEQMEGGGRIDARVDLYAFGALLYELLTGARAWRGMSAAAIAAARLSEPPPDPRARRAEVPEPLAELVLRCLARHPEERPANAEEVLEVLRALLAAAPQAGRAEPTLPRFSAAAPSARDKTVAVLPFRNAGAPEDEYLGDGLTDDVVDTLCVTRGLKVRPRSAVMRAAAGGPDPQRIGAELGVQVIVEGTVRREEGVVRVSARAQSVEDGFQIWAQRFERPAERLFALSDEIARAVAAALTVDFDLPARVTPSDPLAVDLYVRARHALGRAWYGTADVAQAVQLFEEALRHAPEDPTILAGYAMARARLVNHGAPDAAGLRLTREVAERAIALAPHLGEPWLALASVRYVLSDWVGAVTALRTALQRVPGLLKANEMLGHILLEVGETTEAIFRLETTLSLDPMQGYPRCALARAYALAGDWAKADAALGFEGLDAVDRWAKAFHRARLDLWKGEASVVEDAPAEAAGQQTLQAAAVYREVLRTRAVEPAQRQVFELMRGSTSVDSRMRPLFYQLEAELLAFAGEGEEALAAIAAAVEARLFDLCWMDRCPALAPLREGARFASLRAEVAERAAPIRAELARR